MRQAALFDRMNPEPCRPAESVFAAHRAAETAEARRQQTAKDRIVARLRQGPATNLELNAICFRYGGRLHELRGEGFRVEKEARAHGVYVYWLAGDATNGGGHAER